MKRVDLRSRIVPTTIENTDDSQEMVNKKFNTTDLIYLASYNDLFDGQKTDQERRTSATDYAKMNNAYTYNSYRTFTGQQTTDVCLRSAFNSLLVNSVYGDGDWNSRSCSTRDLGLCPSLHYHLPSNISARSAQRFSKKKQDRLKDENDEFNIKEVKDTNGEIVYHTLQIGEYTKTKVNENLSQTLETLYHGGKLKEDITCTGRWYSCNGQKENYKDYAGKHSPEFEYQGNRYARVISYPNDEETEYSDGVEAGKEGTVRWTKIEPISFKILNWDEMPKSINPKGNGKAKYFDLIAEEAIISNIPFYPDEHDQNSTMWQNSTPRGFLNGIDVRNITQNGNPSFGASRGGNFTGECNFLNEAFNLSRQSMIEYAIPDSETEIPDDAFNGCITLKKLIIHSKVKSIGKRAFEGLNFKYSYKAPTGELIFSQELPRNKEEYEDVIELDKISKSFDGFDYSILVQNDKLEEVIKFSEILNKNKFSIPYVYGLALVESGNTKLFFENSDFRFFKSEFPEINDMLLDFPEEERLDFFKFATNLGCFSAEKMLNKKGKETQVLLAQKASSLLAKLLKTDVMRLR
ncbi:MAG: leucine-rich repeat protein [Clostridia bacterium]|nr:leucine-rich repeat protein [Clostridia bacterium]